MLTGVLKWSSACLPCDKFCDGRLFDVEGDLPFATIRAADVEKLLEMRVEWAEEHKVVGVGDDADIDIVEQGSQVRTGALSKQVIDVEIEEKGREDSSLLDARADFEWLADFIIQFDVGR